MEPTELKNLLDMTWVLTAAALVFLMQAGFMCLEAGLTRRKNNINVATKNLADLAIAITFFWLFGYGIMFGETSSGLFGLSDFAPDFLSASKNPESNASPLGLATFFFFQVMFCGTAVTILSGATAERMKFESYLFLSLVISGLIYPLVGHWVWNGLPLVSLPNHELTGWLGRSGFVDFAGSTVVHSVGGWAALATLLILKPRAGRFTKDGAQPLPKANLPLAMLGTILLWFGWFGFNGGSTFAAGQNTAGQNVAVIMANTTLAGAAGLLAVISIKVVFKKKYFEADYLMNGALAGLVAITASCNAVTSREAVIIGFVGGCAMLALDWLLLRLQVDDAVGAIPVHLGGGLWGTLAVAFFVDTGRDFGEQLGIQVVGIFAAFACAFGLTLIILNTIDRFSPLRVTPEEEEEGLNISEHGALPDYSEFPGLKEMLERHRES
jgi:Amt family ammonium transporter